MDMVDRRIEPRHRVNADDGLAGMDDVDVGEDDDFFKSASCRTAGRSQQSE